MLNGMLAANLTLYEVNPWVKMKFGTFKFVLSSKKVSLKRFTNQLTFDVIKGNRYAVPSGDMEGDACWWGERIRFGWRCLIRVVRAFGLYRIDQLRDCALNVLLLERYRFHPRSRLMARASSKNDSKSDDSGTTYGSLRQHHIAVPY